MNAAHVLDHFDRLCDAPDAIPRLRRFILDLAVRGKLVEQDPNDEPHPGLLGYLNRGSLQRVTNLPHGWIQANVGELLNLQYGRALSASERLRVGPVCVFGSNGVVGYCKEALLKEPAIIIGRKGSAGALNVCEGPSWTTDVAYFVAPPSFFKIRYLFFVLQTLNLDKLGKGVKPGLSRNEVYELKITVPPLAEQHRIVAKVDELMALCDRLEAAQTERESQRDKLAAASLHRLNNGADADEFRKHARFHLRHLPRLTTHPEHIQQLRQSILNLAVRGKLVPQDPNDEPASELLKRIHTEKERLLRDGRSTLKLQLPAIHDSETPFQLPTSWSWVRLGELVTDADAGWSPKSEGFPRSGENWGVLKVSAVSWDKFLSEENKQLLPGITPPETAQVHVGDFLISRANTSELVAKCVVVEQEPSKLILSDKIVRLQIVEGCVKKFLSLVNNHAAHARAYYAEEASGTSLSMKNVSRAVIYALAVPLPPLAEQHRIAAKVDELMVLCDRLEAQLNTTETESHRLLEAVLAEVLAT